MSPPHAEPAPAPPIPPLRAVPREDPVLAARPALAEDARARGEAAKADIDRVLAEHRVTLVVAPFIDAEGRIVARWGLEPLA